MLNSPTHLLDLVQLPWHLRARDDMNKMQNEKDNSNNSSLWGLTPCSRARLAKLGCTLARPVVLALDHS
eukprot:4576942-Amphidinium_carterae.2